MKRPRDSRALLVTVGQDAVRVEPTSVLVLAPFLLSELEIAPVAPPHRLLLLERQRHFLPFLWSFHRFFPIGLPPNGLTPRSVQALDSDHYLCYDSSINLLPRY